MTEIGVLKVAPYFLQPNVLCTFEYLCKCTSTKCRIDAVSKRNHEILTALHYIPLYNINRSEKWDKNIQAAAYNGARTLYVKSLV